MIFEKTEHGGDIYDKQIRYDFSVNINPLGTPSSVRQAVIDSVKEISNYPDPCCRKLTIEIAKYESVPYSCIMCGNGAAELIYSFCAALRPCTALEMAPTFSEYSNAAEAVGCKIDRYILKREENFTLTDDFLAYLRSKHYDVVFLCNPNNPTGRLINRGLLEEICRICKKNNTRLFIDECFLELSDDRGVSSMKNMLNEYPNLFILKAFTKSFGMAGLRLGYCLSSDRKLLEVMSRTTQVWNVSAPAQKAGIAALSEKDFIKKANSLILSEREILVGELSKTGFWVCPSQSNYILFYSRKEIYHALSDKGILIRDCSNYYGLEKGWYRIAVRIRKENEELINALYEVTGD